MFWKLHVGRDLVHMLFNKESTLSLALFVEDHLGGGTPIQMGPWAHPISKKRFATMS